MNGQIGLGEPATISLPDGSYRMPALRPGSRIVRQVITPGWIPTNPPDAMHAVTIEPNAEVHDVNFGNRELRDYGDAPLPYPSVKAHNGPVHGVLMDFYLGTVPADGESDAQVTADASGDDLTEMDDDDGIRFLSLLLPGDTVIATATASKDNGILQGWIDFNADGDWDDAGEQIVTDLWLAGGDTSIRFDVPHDATLGETFARFRFGYERGISYDGAALAGEVEDYMLEIGVPGGGGGGGGEGEFNPWQNQSNALDVNNDSFVSPIDALLIMNDLNVSGAKRLTGSPVPTARPSFIDVSGDRFVTAVDALRVINALNARLAAEGERAEGEPLFETAATAAALEPLHSAKDRTERTGDRPRPHRRTDGPSAPRRRLARRRPNGVQGAAGEDSPKNGSTRRSTRRDRSRRRGPGRTTAERHAPIAADSRFPLRVGFT